MNLIVATIHTLTWIVLVVSCTVEAGEPSNISCNTVDGQLINCGPSYWTIEHNNVLGAWTNTGSPIATCDLTYANCQVLKPEAFPCYQKMQGALSIILGSRPFIRIQFLEGDANG